jgi:pimeloyl-ACP methyl ester carboxylesterase
VTEGAYALQQATKPNTLSVGLGDSPAGLAAWIVERMTSWSDCGGDLFSVFPRDDVLTWVTLYWVTGSIGTSFAAYAVADDPVAERAQVPTVVSSFPRDIAVSPRALAERFFDVVQWSEHPVGGHFGAWEQPELFVADLRAAADAGRSR